MQKDSLKLANQIESEFFDKGLYYFYGEVDEDTVKPVIQWIINENNKEELKKELTLYINSCGGSINDAFALIDVMKLSSIPIRTIGTGNLMSAALMIFLSGVAGSRSLTKNTSILCHQFSSISEGKEHELTAAIKEFKLVKQRMINHIQEMCGIEPRVIKRELLPANDVWLSATEALELGIADNILSTLIS